MNKNISCISPSVSPKSEEMIIVGFAYRTSAAAVTTPVSIHCVQGLLLVLLIFRLSQGSWVPLNISLDSYTFSCSEVDSPLSKEKLFVAIGIFRSKLTQTQWPEYHPRKKKYSKFLSWKNRLSLSSKFIFQEIQSYQRLCPDNEVIFNVGSSLGRLCNALPCAQSGSSLTCLKGANIVHVKSQDNRYKI